MRPLLALLVVCVTVAAAAQPMMMDPSKMSGIPRPDPQVPAGTVTVRLIRGTLANRVTGADVTLTGADGTARTARTDGEGRATFAGLPGPGPWIASAGEGESKLASQPIELDAQMGTRVMLVFPVTGAGVADGLGHPDKALAAGTIVVRAEDDAGQAVEGLDVIVGHARQGEPKVQELRGKTDVAGEAKFEGLDHAPTSGYVAEVVAHGTRFPGKPFKLEANMGARVVLTVRQVSSDAGALTIAEGSHLLVEVGDDALQVIEVWRIHNEGGKAFDAGAGGLHIPLPPDAVQAQAPDGNASLAIDGHDAVLHGPVPPGDTQLRVMFVLPYHGDSVVLRQPTPVPFARVALVTQEIEGLQVTGHDVRAERREMQGRPLMVYFGGASTRGGELELTFSGLPHADARPRYAAAALSILLVIVFAVYAAGGSGDRRARLEVERRASLDRLARVEDDLATAPTPALQAERNELTQKLADIYRGLDALGGG